jgi:uncharacterized protein
VTVRIDDIGEVDWSPRLGDPGEVVTGLDDIQQCLDILLNSPKMSVPHRPLFGCDAWRYLDAPATVAVPGITSEVLDAVQLWEPRIEVVSVQVEISVSQVVVALTWRPAGSAIATTTTEVQLARTA